MFNMRLDYINCCHSNILEIMHMSFPYLYIGCYGWVLCCRYIYIEIGNPVWVGCVCLCKA
jgi:hypothetical protein